MFSSLGTVWIGTRSTICSPKPSKPAPLGRVVGQQPHGGDPEVDQDLGPDAVLPAVHRQAQLHVGVDRVQAPVLQLVGLQLVGDPDAPALVAAQVDDRAQAGVGDHAHGGVQLGAAVAAAGSEHVAGEAFAVHPHQHVLLAGGLAHHEGQVGLVVDDALVGDAAELAVLGGQSGGAGAAHQPLASDGDGG